MAQGAVAALVAQGAVAALVAQGAQVPTKIGPAAHMGAYICILYVCVGGGDGCAARVQAGL